MTSGLPFAPSIVPTTVSVVRLMAVIVPPVVGPRAAAEIADQQVIVKRPESLRRCDYHSPGAVQVGSGRVGNDRLDKVAAGVELIDIAARRGETARPARPGIRHEEIWAPELAEDIEGLEARGEVRVEEFATRSAAEAGDTVERRVKDVDAMRPVVPVKSVA